MKASLHKLLLLLFAIALGLSACGAPPPATEAPQPTAVPGEPTAAAEPGGEAEPTVAQEPGGGPVRLSIFVSPEGLFGEITGDTYSYRLVGEATGVTFDVTQGIWENEDEKLSTIFASGDLPTLISLRSEKWVDDLGPRGLFEPLNGYIDAGRMPNLVAQMESRGIDWAEITSADGNIYRAPQFSDIKFINPALLMRADLLEACEIIADRHNPGPPNVIQTTDDLYAAMQCLQTQLGGGAVLAGRDGAAAVLPKVARWFGTSINQYYNPATGAYEYGPLMNRYRVFTEFYAQLYADGILHPDYATLTDAEWSAIHDAGNAGAALENAGWNYQRVGALGVDVGKDFFVQSLTIDGERVLWPAPAELVNGNVLVVAANASQDEKDAAIRVIDFLYSQEGDELIWYGKEGVDWQVGEDGKACFLGLTLYRPHAHGYCDGVVPENVPTFIDYSFLNANPLTRIYGAGWTGKWSGVDNPDVAPDRWNEVTRQFVEGESLTNPLPRIALTQDEIGVTAQFGTALDTYVLEETQKFIEGRRPLTDAEWADFQAQVEALGAQEIVDVYNAALARK